MNVQRLVEDCSQAAQDCFNEYLEEAIGSGEFTREQVDGAVEDENPSLTFGWLKWSEQREATDD